MPKRFRIAFSFAGEKREYVEKVARSLAGRFGEEAILYDQFHEAEFARFDLGVRLPILYGEDSDLIVPVLCDGYDGKRWTGWEWVHIHGLLTKSDGHRVMPSRFNHASVDGLSPSAGFIELDDKTPEQFAALILERLALNEGHPKDYYRLPLPSSLESPHPAVRHNLPTLQPFFGREEELKRIAAALDPDARTWGALIDGPGGMGKTALAIRAASEAAPGVFKRIIFISLKRRELDDDGVRDLSAFLISGLAELFNELAGELARGDIAKAPEDQRPRLLVDALRDTQSLLVLDNLESLVKRERDTLFTFVRKLPAGCKAILTSRGRIGSAAEELILEKLSEEAALATLAELATRNPLLAATSLAERLELYHATGGKPLLLRWTAGQLGRGHCLTFTDALHFIRSCPEENDPLEFIFGDLVDDFEPAETRILCALTCFTQPAKVEYIAAIASPSPDGLAEADIQTSLRSLVNRALVVPSDERKAFVLVPMVADFVRKRMSEMVAEIGHRLEARAYGLIVGNGGEEHARFPALEAAWPGVAPALPLFLAGESQRLQTVCEALKFFLEFSGRWDDAISLSNKAEARAVEAGDFANAARRAHDAGWIHYLRREAHRVMECADREVGYWRAAQAGPCEEASAIRLHGLGHHLVEHHFAAIEDYERALQLYRSLPPDQIPARPAYGSDIAIVLNYLGAAHHRLGNRDEAERYYRQSLDAAVAARFEEGVACFTGDLASLALDREDWPAAETLVREALRWSEVVHRQELIAANSHRLARALVPQGQTAEAQPHARRAVEIFTTLAHPDLARAETTLRECEH